MFKEILKFIIEHGSEPSPIRKKAQIWKDDIRDREKTMFTKKITVCT